jgi:hypothetical protein
VQTTERLAKASKQIENEILHIVKINVGKIVSINAIG